ncbi:MAG: phosphatidylinositol kinase [Acidimicrobiales bacterium]
MNRDEQQTLLLKGSIEVEGRVVASSNQALLVTVSLDGLVGQACYKAEAGERPLWDFPDGLWRREVAAYELDVALGTDLVPTTVGRDDGPFGVGSLQWWVDDNEEDHYFTLREHPQFHEWFAELAAFDVIANNADRKAGHVIYDGERCWAIDNGLCFHEQDERIDRFANGDTGHVGDWLNPIELALAQSRAHGLVENATYPAPDEDSDWPPYPWPLI